MTPRPEHHPNALLANTILSKFAWAECEPVPLLEYRPDSVLGQR